MEMTELLAVRDKLNVAVRELSLGERMKMELIASLLHRPKVLFLDEPTIGLDVVSQKTVREFLRAHNTREEDHHPADQPLHGRHPGALRTRHHHRPRARSTFDGRLSEVVDRFADFKLITIQCDGAANCPAERLDTYGEVVEQKPGSITLKVKRDRVIPVCKALLDELPVSDIDIQEVPIEDVIRRIFAR